MAYYAIERSSDYLAHYGIKGMKWGVRKAIESGNSRKLDRAYRKATKKLAKLEDKANINKQKSLAESRNTAAKLLGRFGLLNAGVAVGGHLGANASREKAWDVRYNELDPVEGLKKYKSWESYRNHVEDAARKYDNLEASANKLRNLSLGIGAASLGTAAIAKLASNKAKKRTTPQGHKAAAMERDAWRSEMRKAFKGTKYNKLPGSKELKSKATKNYIDASTDAYRQFYKDRDENAYNKRRKHLQRIYRYNYKFADSL